MSIIQHTILEEEVIDDEADFIAAASALKQLILASQQDAASTGRRSFTVHDVSSDVSKGSVEISLTISKAPEGQVLASSDCDVRGDVSQGPGRSQGLNGERSGLAASSLENKEEGVTENVEDEVEEEEDDFVAAAAVLRKLSMGCSQEDPLGLANPFSWNELELSCQKLDSSDLRISTVDLSCLLENGNSGAAGGEVLYNFELDTTADATQQASGEGGSGDLKRRNPLQGAAPLPYMPVIPSSTSLPAPSAPRPSTPPARASRSAPLPSTPAEVPASSASNDTEATFTVATSAPQPAPVEVSSPPCREHSSTADNTSVSGTAVKAQYSSSAAHSCSSAGSFTAAPSLTPCGTFHAPAGEYWAHIGLTPLVVENIRVESTYVPKDPEVYHSLRDSTTTNARPRGHVSKWVLSIKTKYLGMFGRQKV